MKIILTESREEFDRLDDAGMGVFLLVPISLGSCESCEKTETLFRAGQPLKDGNGSEWFKYAALRLRPNHPLGSGLFVRTACATCWQRWKPPAAHTLYRMPGSAYSNFR